MVDRSNPLLDLRIKERVIFEPTLQMEWTVAQEWTNHSGDIIQREFSELEHGEALELEVLPGAPSGHPDPFSHHYSVKREFIEKVYVAQKLQADSGDLAAFNNFFGWDSTANVYTRTELWTDTFVRCVIWQLMSKPTPTGSANDRIFFFNESGNITSQQTIGEATSFQTNIGRLWGLRATASHSGFNFEIRSSGGTLVRTRPRNGACGRQVPSQPGAPLGNPSLPPPSEVTGFTPYALTHPVIRVVAPSLTRPYLEEEVIDPSTSLPTLVPVVRVVEEVRLFLYGQYWMQELEFINAFNQGWLVHPTGTPLAQRLKPPGKSHLSDVFNKEQGRFQPNAEWR